MSIVVARQSLRILFFLATYLIMSGASAKSVADDREQKKLYQQKCLEIQEFLVQGRYGMDCFTNYHHYNSKAFKKYYRKGVARNAGQVEIGGYNLLYPGTNKSAFKDYKLLARVINKWDVVGAIELLPVVGRDLRNNNTVVAFLEEGPEALKKHSLELDQLKKIAEKDQAPNHSDQVKGLEEKISKLKADLADIRSLYRAPGYLKIFEELMKLDPSWSMILTPRGDAAEPTHVHELVGFFYRSSMVKPIVNEHCDQYKKAGEGIAYGCIPNFRKDFMGRETSHVFSRRPFITSFESGSFDFTLITSHVIYSSPDEPEKMKSILKPSFGVEDYTELGPGATKLTYARLAEMKVTLELMERLRTKYDEDDVILVSDTNLRPTNPFWERVFEEMPGGELLIEEATSLTQSRFNSDGTPTGGFSSSYDHFIIDGESSSECVDDEGYYNASKTSYFTGDIRSYIKRKYIVRSEDKIEVEEGSGVLKTRYRLTAAGKTKMEKELVRYRKELEKVKTIKKGRIVPDHYQIDARVEAYRERVFMQQLEDRTFYRVYSEVLSDHFPINLTCFNK